MTYWVPLKTVLQVCGFGAATSIIFYIVPLSHSAMRESPEDAAAHWLKRHHVSGVLTPAKLPIIDAAAMERFLSTGILIIDDVLTANELKAARMDLQILLDGDSFQRTDQHSDEIRTDSTCLISETISNQTVTLGIGMRDALRVVRSVPLELINKGSGAQSQSYGVPLSNQLSSYNSTGSHYKPHRDTPDYSGYHPLQWLLQAGLNERETTIILYLNDANWDSGVEHDGCLRCFIGSDADDETGASAKEILYIAPKGGRLVIFDSKVLLHEVCPCSKQRSAITCWVGGSHSTYTFLRPFCVPYAEMKFF